MQITFLTAASAPSGRPSWRPSRCARPCFSSGERTSKATVTVCTPSSARTLSTTAFSKWARIGQPAVVRDTTTSTRPSSGCSIDRTMPKETMSLRSSGSMTLRSASSICSRVRIAFDDGRKANAAPEGTAPAEGGEILHWRRDMWPPALPRVRSPPRSGGSVLLGDRSHARDDGLDLLLRLAAGQLDLLLDPATVRLHRLDGLAAALAQLALHAGAGALDLAHRAVAGGVAATLELAQAGADALLQALQLLVAALGLDV